MSIILLVHSLQFSFNEGEWMNAPFKRVLFLPGIASDLSACDVIAADELIPGRSHVIQRELHLEI